MKDALEFYREFVNVMNEADPECGMEVYRKGGDRFTKAVTKTINGILSQYGSVSNEYFRVDACAWKDRKTELSERTYQMKPHLWDLIIAVEHENNPTDWTDEVIKLAHIRCPIKVVIGYVPCDRRQEDDLRLCFAAESLEKLRCCKKDTDEQFLVILGNGTGKECKLYDRFDYRGYLLNIDKMQFERI